MGNILDEQGMVCVWHMPIFYLPPITHTELPFKDDIHGERGQENPDTVSHQIPLDIIREQQTIKLFLTASPPPKPPTPEPPPHPC